MTTKIEINGASDDTLVVSGAVNEEFPYAGQDDRGDLLVFSDGTVLRAKFDTDGVWRLTPYACGSGKLTIDQAIPHQFDNRTDRATLELPDDVANVWAVHGTSIAVPR